MRRNTIIRVLTVLALSAAAHGSPEATFTLGSPQNGQDVAPGATVNWEIRLAVSAGDNAGLALVSCDLVQDAANPAKLDLPPADGVPGGMAKFARSAGIANPGSAAPSFGYRGAQRSPTGQTYKNLVQIGGGQNTFGTALPPGGGVGENATVVAGIGQGAEPQIIATGSFTAPTTPGAYTFRLVNALANVLDPDAAPPPGQHWPVSAAAVAGLPSASFSFTVAAVDHRGDLNCDGVVNVDDIGPFALGLVDPAGYAVAYPACFLDRADMNGDALIDGHDVQSFVDRLLTP